MHMNRIAYVVLELVDVVHLERDEYYAVAITYQYFEDSVGESKKYFKKRPSFSFR